MISPLLLLVNWCLASNVCHVFFSQSKHLIEPCWACYWTGSKLINLESRLKLEHIHCKHRTNLVTRMEYTCYFLQAKEVPWQHAWWLRSFLTPKKKDTIGCPFEDRHWPVHLVFYYGSDIISIWHMHMGMEYPSYMICFVREIPRNSWVHLNLLCRLAVLLYGVTPTIVVLPLFPVFKKHILHVIVYRTLNLFLPIQILKTQEKSTWSTD